MRRLVDADKIIMILNDYALREAPRENESTGERRLSMIAYNAIQNCIKSVKQQPVAYDVDAVVEQMEEYHEEMEQFKCGGMLSDMIEVVKAGGIIKENELSKDDADLER